MQIKHKTVGEESIVYTVEFVNSLQATKSDYNNFYSEKGWQFAEQLAKEGLIDYHSLLAFRQIGVVLLYGEDIDSDLDPLFDEDRDLYDVMKSALLSIGKDTLFNRIDNYLDEMFKVDVVFDCYHCLHGLVLFFYNALRDLENHI